MTASDIANIPPLDTSGEMAEAARFLNRTRKQLREHFKSADWRLWIAKSLLQGEQEEHSK